MDSSIKTLETLKDIKKIMERSSRFISLSDWSGIVVGICALIGAFIAHSRIHSYMLNKSTSASPCPSCLKTDLLIIALLLFVTAFVIAALFTLFKSKKQGVPIWGNSARRLLWNTILPMLAGGFMLWRMMELKQYDLIASGCLLFYGLALVNGSKYTLGEIRYLGYAEITLGIVSLWFLELGLVFWAIGFGLFHIIYGFSMWWKYDRVSMQIEIDDSGNKIEE